MTNGAHEPKAHVVPDVIQIDQEQVRSHVDEAARSPAVIATPLVAAASTFILRSSRAGQDFGLAGV